MFFQLRTDNSVRCHFWEKMEKLQRIAVNTWYRALHSTWKIFNIQCCWMNSVKESSGLGNLTTLAWQFYQCEYFLTDSISSRVTSFPPKLFNSLYRKTLFPQEERKNSSRHRVATSNCKQDMILYDCYWEKN